MLIHFNQLPRKINGLKHEISIHKKLSFSAYYAGFPISGSQVQKDRHYTSQTVMVFIIVLMLQHVSIQFHS